MTFFLDIFASFWHFWMFISLGIGIFGFGLLMYSPYGKSKNNSKVSKTLIILFVQTILTWIIGFGLLWIIQYQARIEFIQFLNQSSLTVIVNGEMLDSEKSKLVISELKRFEISKRIILIRLKKQK